MTKIKNKKWPVVTMIIALIAVYNLMPMLNSAGAVGNITAAKDLISDSDLGEVALHTITFTTGATTPLGGYITVTFDPLFGDFATSSCPGGFTISTSTEVITCTADGLTASSTFTIYAQMANPSTANEYPVYIQHYDDSAVLVERVTVYVAIIEDILVTATVDSILDFVVSATGTDATVNGVACTGLSTATSTAFGTIDSTASSTLCHRLQVDTNAEDGFAVTVEQDGELIADSGANINSFIDSPTGTGSSTVLSAWQSPAAIIDNYDTYGHFGLTSQDGTLSWGGGNPFGASLYAGFNGTDPIEVMYHTGPVTSDIDDKGSTYVAYTLEISVLQEAGDYESTLTYICTPQY